MRDLIDIADGTGIHPRQGRRLGLTIAVFLLLAAVAPCFAASASPLRVCADPHNLPFSDRHGGGFENQIATIMAASLHRSLTYYWFAEGPDFVRDTLEAHACDVIIGMPSLADGLSTTQAYYWSSYVLISRADRHLKVVPLDDHRLRHLKIGVEAVLDNAFYSPPARQLEAQGLSSRVIPFGISAASASGRAPAHSDSRRALIEALASGRIDLAAVWGPAFGEEILRSPVQLAVVPVGDTSEFSSRKKRFDLQAMQYEISMAVRPADTSLRASLVQAIDAHRSEITHILEHYGVPLIDPARLGTPLTTRATISPEQCRLGNCKSLSP